MMEKLIGLILCGGKSSRMGHDKGLMLTENTTWAVKLKLLLEQVGIVDVLISVGNHNKEAYFQYFSEEQLIVDQEFNAVPTPLIGVLSTHLSLKAKEKQKDLFVLACDLQLIDEEVISLLLQSYQENKNKLIHLLTDGAFLQPLAGIYKYEGLENLYQLAQSQQNKSIRSLVQALKTEVIELPNPIKYKLKNFNSPADL